MTLLKKYSLHRVWLLSFAVIILLLFVNGTLAYKTLGDLTRHQRSVVGTLNTINSVSEVYTALLNAEVGQRGYLLTGQVSYLEPFRASIGEMENHLDALAAVTVPSPEQQALVKRLGAAVTQQLAALDELTSRPAGDLSTLPSQQIATQAITDMAEVRELVAQIKAQQYSFLEHRQANAHKSQRNAFATLVTATVVSLLLLLLIYLLVRHSSSTREKLTQDLQKANEDLEQKVRQRTATLSHYANELGRSNRELQDFAFVASHDLQEPLRKIRAFGNRLQQKYAVALGEQGGDYINRMQAAAERMSRLINDLLAFSRVATKGKPFENTALNTVLQDVLEDLEVAIDEAQAKVEFDDLPVIEADPTQMRQLFQNLLGNAIKFREPDVAPVITLRSEVLAEAEIEGDLKKDVCEITITDNGIGFDQQFMERIFTPFQRLHGREQYAGTGIGLAVCRRIVERHQGSITAQSESGKGAKFLLRLPLKQHLQPVHEIHDHDLEQPQDH